MPATESANNLTTFRGSHPAKADVIVAKNYLSETELRKLNNMVLGYFDIAEYRKYQQRTLTPVEQAYIAQLQQEAKQIKK